MMITFNDVSKDFPLGNIALDKVSFEIEKNDFVFLVGPSGAGKTSIIKLILREMTPSSGTITIDDFEITDKKFKKIEKLRQKLGVVFQDFKILTEKNVFENVAMSLKVMDYPKNKIKEEVEKALKLVGLKEKKLVFPAQLSAGELQRVAIARAIIGDRDILLADEPTGNLDPKTSWEIMKIFKKLEKKKTVLIATHNSDIVNSFQKRVIALKKGKIISDVRKGGYQL